MKDTKPTRAKELETILTLCVACVVIFMVSKKNYWLTISVLLGLIGLFIPFVASKISWAWLKLGEGIGFVMSKVILAAIFWGLLTPIAFLSRVLGSNKNPLQLKKENTDSYYFTRNYKYQPKDLENTW